MVEHRILRRDRLGIRLVNAVIRNQIHHLVDHVRVGALQNALLNRAGGLLRLGARLRIKKTVPPCWIAPVAGCGSAPACG